MAIIRMESMVAGQFESKNFYLFYLAAIQVDAHFDDTYYFPLKST